MGCSFANQTPNNESHPIHPTQELPGSALIYSSQAVESEKRELYAHLRSSVRDARKVLEPLIEEGIIGANVSEKLHAFELIMPSDLPLRGEDWEEIANDLFLEIEQNSPRLRELFRAETLRR